MTSATPTSVDQLVFDLVKDRHGEEGVWRIAPAHHAQRLRYSRFQLRQPGLKLGQPSFQLRSAHDVLALPQAHATLHATA
jgi:hypothetical protein